MNSIDFARGKKRSGKNNMMAAGCISQVIERQEGDAELIILAE